jgi:long-subunit acyl-CoA synthetase (AMP-forming)
VLEEVAAGVARANEQLDSGERIVRHVVLPDEWAPGVELTPTMKLRRRSIGARYGDLIDGLYSA